MAKLNPANLVTPLGGYYEKALQILEGEKTRLGSTFSEHSRNVDDFFGVANKKLKDAKAPAFQSKRFSPRGARQILPGWQNNVAIGKALEDKQSAINNLSLGLKSVADAMNSEAMVVLANAVSKAKIN
jgi:hypothetical protein